MPVELIALTLFALSQIGTPGPANMALLALGRDMGCDGHCPLWRVLLWENSSSSGLWALV